jgi:hypothetical protein
MKHLDTMRICEGFLFKKIPMKKRIETLKEWIEQTNPSATTQTKLSYEV